MLKIRKTQIIDFNYDDICEECGKPWNSEYHISDQCVSGEEIEAER